MTETNSRGLSSAEMTTFRAAQIVRKRILTTRAQVRTACHLAEADPFSSLVDDRVIEIRPGAAGQEGGSGRPADLVALAPQLGYLIGVDISHGVITATATAANFDQILPKLYVREAIRTEEDPDAAFDVAAELIEELFDELRGGYGAQPSDVIGIGLGLPGPIDREQKQVSSEMHILSGWRNRLPGDEIAGRIKGLLPDIRVEVDNDATLGALGVYSWEILNEEDPSSAIRDLLYVRITDGIGAGLVIKGKLVGGGSGFAGEIGHIRVDEGGSFCPRCGHRGCVETKASERSIRAFLGEDIVGDGVGDVDIAAVLRSSHPAVANALWEAGWHLGIALAHARNLLDPRRIYLGGRMAQQENFRHAVIHAVARNSLGLRKKAGELIAVPPAGLAKREDLRSPELLGALAIALHRCGDAFIERRIIARSP